MSRRILWINPIAASKFDKAIQENLEAGKMPDTEVRIVSLERGPKHLEYYYYGALVLPDTLRLVKKAENEGFDAAIIGCFYDPGLREAREITNRLVVTAPAEASMHLAATLGDRFSIIVAAQKSVPLMRENACKYGFGDKLVSFKSIELGVLDFHKNETDTARRIKQAAEEAVEHDKADVVILGCGLLFNFYKELQDYLEVPVIDAILAPLKYAEYLIEVNQRFGWIHSKKYGYKSPPFSELHEWDLERY